MIPHFPMGTAVPHKTVDIPSIAVWAITPNGVDIGCSLVRHLCGATLFLPGKLAKTVSMPRSRIVFSNLSKELTRQFHRFSGHVFIFSTGIAVRLIAPLLVSKTTDPSVVVLDDNGRHAISLLSGHLGGGNALAQTVARITSGTPVITTATDVNQVPAIDMIAQSRNLFIETVENIKLVNMAFLTGKPLHVKDPQNHILPDIPGKFIAGPDTPDTGGPDIFCSYKTETVSRETLILRPRVLCIGIGCNRGTPYEVIRAFLMETLEKEKLSADSIRLFGTTDIKKDEPGLSRLSERLGIEMVYYSKAELNSVKSIENPSKMVQKHLGVKSVCEAAAILNANHGELIVPKKKNRDVTIAVAIKK